MTRLNQSMSRLGSLAPVVLRVVVGGVMAYHGIDKLRGGVDGVEEMFAMLGAPAPALTAPLVTGIEITAGLALIVGVATRFAAIALAFVLIGAIAYVKIDLGIIANGPMPGAELDLSLLAGLVAIALLGPGELSVDRAIGLEDPVATPA